MTNKNFVWSTALATLAMSVSITAANAQAVRYTCKSSDSTEEFMIDRSKKTVFYQGKYGKVVVDKDNLLEWTHEAVVRCSLRTDTGKIACGVAFAGWTGTCSTK